MDVIHRERVALQCAGAVVAAATTDAYWWLVEAIGHDLGPAYELDLTRTRDRLQREEGGHRDPFSAEVARWRARLDDLLAGRPELGPAVRRLTEETTLRMRP